MCTFASTSLSVLYPFRKASISEPPKRTDCWGSDKKLKDYFQKLFPDGTIERVYIAPWFPESGPGSSRVTPAAQKTWQTWGWWFIPVFNGRVPFFLPRWLVGFLTYQQPCNGGIPYTPMKTAVTAVMDHPSWHGDLDICREAKLAEGNDTPDD